MVLLRQLLELFKSFGELVSLPDWIVNEITFVLLLLILFLSILGQLYRLIKKLFKIRNQRVLNADLHPFFTKRDIYNYTSFYISQNYQNVSPSEDEEPGRIYIASAKNKLTPLFLNKVFSRYKGDGKYFLLLADTGMGKTAFLINLYIRYKNRVHFFWRLPKYNIKLFPLGYPKVDQWIESVTDKENTILILDAFDEDMNAIVDYKKRLGEIIEKVSNFRFVLITCRTQFFPTSKEEPHEAGHFTYGQEGQYKFQKLYLSVFSNYDVINYLIKKYKYNWIKFYKAFQIVRKSPNLMIRPMLLSYIGELVDTKHDFKYTFQIYETLIKKWIVRESEKPAMASRYNSPQRYQELLESFSLKFAINIYENRERRGGYWVHHSEQIGKKYGIQLSDFENDIELTDEDKKGRSLLNRNSEGNYKFSHKSILEYLLAKELVKNLDFLDAFNFQGMDAAKNFYEEMVTCFLNERKGDYLILNSKERALAQLTLSEFKEVYSLIIQDASSLFNNSFQSEIEKLAGLKNIKTVIIGDKSFAYAYFIQLCIYFQESCNANNSQALNVLLKEFDPLAGKMSELKMLNPHCTVNKYLKLMTSLDFSEEIKKLIVETFDSKILTNERISNFRQLKSLLNVNFSPNAQYNAYIGFLKKMQKIGKNFSQDGLYY